MKIVDKIKSLFSRRPPTAEEITARTKAEVLREQVREEEARHKSAMDTNWPP